MTDASQQARRGQSIALPSNLLQEQFGKVYVRDDGAQKHVEFTLWLKYLPESLSEGWKTGVALDGSDSMKDWYGRSARPVKIPDEVMQEYARKGWLIEKTKDGRKSQFLKRAAYDDAFDRGFIEFTENIVQSLAREFTAYLSAELSADGQVSVIYWACNDDGAGCEVVGDMDQSQCEALELKGPQRFGGGTKITPAVRHFAEQFRNAPQSLCVFITDGQLQDMKEIKSLTTQLAKEVDAGKRRLMKCILIGVGNHIDEAQMEELDDLETGTDIDIWDHKIASEMRSLSEIMVELVAENRGISAMAAIYDASGNEVARFTDGMPAKVQFAMPADSEYFELEVGGRRMRQTVVVS